MQKTSFWKYFFNTIKESKWLLLRYFIVGIYLIVVEIIANKLNLNDLTYYNSMITLCYLGEMIAFGFCEGFGLYINQHINESEKARKYAKLGFYFTIGFVLVLFMFFAIFPTFITKTILNLNFEIDLTFYYLMIIAFVFITIFNYVLHLLRKIGVFKNQLLITIIQCCLITLSMLSILLIDSLMLIPIGILYIVVHIICNLCGHIALIKNKQFHVNLFKFEKLHITKKELKVISARALSEIVWEIGYLFISFFILKIDVIAYNQYCYFENVLDILNGIYFAFVSVVSIKICRCIGEEKKEEAKLHAKYAIFSTFVIWIIYATISLIIFIPLKNEMNIELQDTAFISLILYLVLSLFRFLEWTMGTYITGQSEYFAKGGFILETIFMIYWIVFYLIANIIPANLFIIYGIMVVDNITKIIVTIFIMKNPKWLEKSE